MARVFRRSLPSGNLSRYYYLEYQQHGQRVFRRTDPPTPHKSLALEQLARALNDPDEVPRSRRTPSVKAVMTAYGKHLQAHAKTTWRSCHARVEWWSTRWEDRSIASVGLSDIDEATEDLRRGRAPDTVAGYLSIFRAAVNRAILDGQVSSHPAARLEIRDRSPKRRVLFSDEEVEAVCALLPPWAAGVVRVARTTGLRLGDILGLRWENVLDDRLVWRQEKTSQDTVIPLTGAARGVLAALPRSSSPWVFPRPARRHGAPATRWDGQGFYKVWWPALESTGLSWRGNPAKQKPPKRSGKRFHDLRRTWATAVLNAGASMEQVAALLGQESTSVTDRYTVHQFETLLKAAEKGASRGSP